MRVIFYEGKKRIAVYDSNVKTEVDLLPKFWWAIEPTRKNRELFPREMKFDDVSDARAKLTGLARLTNSRMTIIF